MPVTPCLNARNIVSTALAYCKVLPLVLSLRLRLSAEPEAYCLNERNCKFYDVKL
jgi:hypothetical protein